MFPKKEIAIEELALAGRLNPGPWVDHSRNVANAAKLIAERCETLDAEKAFVCGLLHDVGRRTGVAAVTEWTEDPKRGLDLILVAEVLPMLTLREFLDALEAALQ